MPVVLMCVKATIIKGREEEFNRWYHEDHIPKALAYPGMVSARRYKALMGEEKWQYMTLYEIKDEAEFRRRYSAENEHLKQMRTEYAAKWGAKDAGISERQSFFYTQVWP